MRPFGMITKKAPTVEEVAHEFTHSCYFTKLDAHHGYCAIILDQESSLLTTFNSPLGRYHFLWFPSGLVCSQDIFRKKNDQILEECQGCIGITDDITVHGCTKVEYNAHLWNLMHVTCKYRLVFNPQKTHVKAPAINFFAAFIMLMVSTWTQIRSMLYMLYQHQQMSPNSRSS